MTNALVPFDDGSLIPRPRGWLDRVRRRVGLPVRVRTAGALRPRALLPACHGIPLGLMIDERNRKLYERWIYYGLDRPKSLITVAPNRSGKTFTQLGYELALFGGRINGVAPSVIINDKKGELLQICGRARYELGDRVYKIDPYGIVPPSPWVVDACLNLLDGLTPHDTTDLLAIAGGLIVAQGHDPHWFERPRQLVACLLANMVDDNCEPACLPYLMTILGLPDADFRRYMTELAQNSPIPFVRLYAGAFTAEDSNENRSIISSAMGQLGFLADAPIVRVLAGRSAFRWEDVKRGGVSVFFCLPEKVASTASRFVRTFWTSAINAMYQPPFHPVLLIIDEAANSLGATSELFEHAFALGGGFGLRLHLLFQNLPQLYGLFREQSESVMSSAGVWQFFRPNDKTTAHFIMGRTGNMTYPVMQENQSISMNDNVNERGEKTASFGQSTSFSWQYYDRPRWTEQQLYEMSVHKQLLFFEGIGAPVIAWRKPYTHSQWASRFDENAYVTRR